MPIHDWSKVDANLFHDFHQAWSIAIRNALNGGVLPKGYSALVEQRTAGVVPDVLAIEHDSNSSKGIQRGGAVVTATRPKARHVIQATKTILADKANRIAIHHPLGEVVCIIEILSPGNKTSRGALQKLVDKTLQLLVQGVHVLIVDLFPPTRTLATYIAGGPLADITTTPYIEPIGVGEKLPDMPAYLDLDSFVYVPLEATYEATWLTCPEAMRAVVERAGK